MSRIFKSALWLLGAGAGFAILLILYFAVTMIDETVVKGEAYGFEIGRSKIESFKDAATAFAGEEVLIRETDGKGPGPRIGQRVPFSFSDSGLAEIKDQDVWEFFLDERYPDYVRLTFESGQLVEIRRHRQYFELP